MLADDREGHRLTVKKYSCIYNSFIGSSFRKLKWLSMSHDIIRISSRTAFSLISKDLLIKFANHPLKDYKAVIDREVIAYWGNVLELISSVDDE